MGKKISRRKYTVFFKYETERNEEINEARHTQLIHHVLTHQSLSKKKIGRDKKMESTKKSNSTKKIWVEMVQRREKKERKRERTM